MNREIKFRAWTDQGHYEVFVMRYDVGILPDNVGSDWQENGFGLFIKPNSRHILMQFTGLKDKNGKEIYEGDILKFSGEITEVRFMREGIQWEGEGKFYVSFWATFSPSVDREIYPLEGGGEIIGNIYETPDLLKQNYKN